MMLSNKPYLLRAFYQWIVDSQCTPHLIVQADFPDVDVPEQYIDEEGKIILNVTPKAIQGLNITKESVVFSASFSGKTYQIFLPLPAIRAIYASENGEGMMFDEEDTKDYFAAKKADKNKKQASFLHLVEDEDKT